MVTMPTLAVLLAVLLAAEVAALAGQPVATHGVASLASETRDVGGGRNTESDGDLGSGIDGGHVASDRGFTLELILAA